MSKLCVCTDICRSIWWLNLFVIFHITEAVQWGPFPAPATLPIPAPVHVPVPVHVPDPPHVPVHVPDPAHVPAQVPVEVAPDAAAAARNPGPGGKKS